jgi:DNA-binding NtrC family response regulator
MSIKILIADDDAAQRRLIAMLLIKKLGYKIVEAENGQDALSILDADTKEQSIQLIILDLRMPKISGFEVLEQININHPGKPVIILTGSHDVQDAVNAMQMGAIDFMTKPVSSERMIVSVQNALKMSTLTKEVTRLKKKESGTAGFEDLIGYDGGLSDIVGISKKAASSDIPTLLTGETGVGKEVFARAIHGESNRAGAPFIAVNCGAIPENLVESTLFGHEKGAFTGAIQKAAGKFREAEGGTIFLDEVGDLPLDAQVKLLRVLQQKEVEPVGAGRAVPVNVRIISATHRNLEDSVRSGEFREDLYFRLNVFKIELPALRARPIDIPALAHHFITRFSASENSRVNAINEAALQKLQTHSWPGNVRELENTLHRAMVLCETDHIEADDIIFETAGKEVTPSQTSTQQSAVASINNRHGSATPHGTGIESNTSAPYIISVIDGNGQFRPMSALENDAMHMSIEFHNGNITHAAKALGIAKSTFYRKMDKAL